MARDFSEVLQQAMEFYVAGQLVEARALLLDIVRADPRLEAGWMFLSYTLGGAGSKSGLPAQSPRDQSGKCRGESRIGEVARHFRNRTGGGRSHAYHRRALLGVAPFSAGRRKPASRLPHASAVPGANEAPAVSRCRAARRTFTLRCADGRSRLSLSLSISITPTTTFPSSRKWDFPEWTRQTAQRSKPFITSAATTAAPGQKPGASSAPPAEPIRKTDQPAQPAGRLKRRRSGKPESWRKQAFRLRQSRSGKPANSPKPAHRLRR